MIYPNKNLIGSIAKQIVKKKLITKLLGYTWMLPPFQEFQKHLEKLPQVLVFR